MVRESPRPERSGREKANSRHHTQQRLRLISSSLPNPNPTTPIHSPTQNKSRPRPPGSGVPPAIPPPLRARSRRAFRLQVMMAGINSSVSFRLGIGGAFVVKSLALVAHFGLISCWSDWWWWYIHSIEPGMCMHVDGVLPLLEQSIG